MEDVKVDAHTGDELPKLLPQGEYVGTIVGFGDVRMSKRQENVYFMPIIISVERQRLFTYVSGFLSTVRFIKNAEFLYLDKNVRVRLRHVKYDERVYGTTDFLDFADKVDLDKL